MDTVHTTTKLKERSSLPISNYSLTVVSGISIHQIDAALEFDLSAS